MSNAFQFKYQIITSRLDGRAFTPDDEDLLQEMFSELDNHANELGFKNLMIESGLGTRSDMIGDKSLDLIQGFFNVSSGESEFENYLRAVVNDFVMQNPRFTSICRIQKCDEDAT